MDSPDSQELATGVAASSTLRNCEGSNVSVTTAVRSQIRRQLQIARNQVLGLVYAGTGRDCPVCEKSARKFLRAGDPPRDNAQCPNCACRERHRLLWLYLTRKTNLFDGQPKRFLHVAPEASLRTRLQQRLGDGYISADLMDPTAMIKMDVERNGQPDNSFDAIYCSHVLEHVNDDRLAIREFFRICKPGGWAILLVPVTVEKTVEDPSITDPRERKRLFGQEDHVRRYGHDYADRLREAGFDVTVTSPGDMLSPEDILRFGTAPKYAGDIFYCVKPA